MRILFYCGVLAGGELVAVQVSRCAEAWPVAVVLTGLVVLFGYGASIAGWRPAALFLLGVTLVLFASVGRERMYRERPWLRTWNRPIRLAEGADGRFSPLRRDFSRRCGLGLGWAREIASLNRAILLGDRSRLSPRMRQTFVDSGTMHLFAISGLHVMAVARVLAFLMAILFVPRRLCGVLALPFLWGYVGLIGWSPSAVRAAIMATFYHGASVFWRRSDGLRAWALTFFLVHLVNPLLIVDVGCALSFSVMLAIVLVGRFTQTCGAGRRAVLATIAAWMAGVPISAHVFGRVTPGGVLANLILVNTAFYSVMSGVVGVLSSFLSETVAAHLNNFSALVTQGMVGVAAAVSRLPGANVEVSRWTYLQCAAWYGVLAAMFVFLRRILLRRSSL